MQTQTEKKSKKKSKKNGGKKANGRVNGLYGFKIAELDIEALRAAIKAKKLEDKPGLDPANDDPEQLAVALAGYFEDLKLPDDDKTECEECLGVAPDEYEDCPFCGCNGEVDPDEKDEEAEAVADENEPTVEPGKASEQKNGKAPKAEKSAETALTKPVVHQGEVLTEKNLDEEIAEVQRLRTAELTSHWALCQKIRQLHESRLWTLRLENGKQRWTTWESFCLGELNMTPVAALSYVEVAKNSTEKQVVKLGTSKAYLLLKAAPEDRKGLEEKLDKGEIKTARELKTHVKESRAKAGDRLLDNPQKRGGAKGAKKKNAKLAKAKAATDAGKLTISQILGKSTVALYKKPASLRGVTDFTTLKRAMKIGDAPIGKLELQNEVTLHFAVKLMGKGLVIEVNAVRETD